MTPRRSRGAARGNSVGGTDSTALNGYTRHHVDQDLRHYHCRRRQRRRRQPRSTRSASCLRRARVKSRPDRRRSSRHSRPAGILRIAVAQHPLQMKVDEICRMLKPDYFQTDVEDLRELKIPPHIKVLPVVRFGRKTPSPLPARIVFEGPTSGIGELADWGRAAELARQTRGHSGGRPVHGECRRGDPGGETVRRRREFSGVESEPRRQGSGQDCRVRACGARRRRPLDGQRMSAPPTPAKGAAMAGAVPDAKGRFGAFGGRYVPETLVPALDRLQAGIDRYLRERGFPGANSTMSSRPGSAAPPRCPTPPR